MEKYEELNKEFNVIPTEVTVDESQVVVGVDRENPTDLLKQISKKIMSTLGVIFIA